MAIQSDIESTSQTLEDNLQALAAQQIESSERALVSFNMDENLRIDATRGVISEEIGIEMSPELSMLASVTGSSSIEDIYSKLVNAGVSITSPQELHSSAADILQKYFEIQQGVEVSSTNGPHPAIVRLSKTTFGM